MPLLEKTQIDFIRMAIEKDDSLGDSYMKMAMIATVEHFGNTHIEVDDYEPGKTQEIHFINFDYQERRKFYCAMAQMIRDIYGYSTELLKLR